VKAAACVHVKRSSVMWCEAGTAVSLSWVVVTVTAVARCGWGLISLILPSKSGMSALGWLFKISLVDPLVQWIQSSSQRRQMSIPQCVILPIWREVGCVTLQRRSALSVSV